MMQPARLQPEPAPQVTLAGVLGAVAWILLAALFGIATRGGF